MIRLRPVQYCTPPIQFNPLSITPNPSLGQCLSRPEGILTDEALSSEVSATEVLHDNELAEDDCMDS
jgi:hypothetical protein